MTPSAPAHNQPGLLHQHDDKAYRTQRHLHHATKPPVVPLTEQQEAQLRADGYQDEHIEQEYPKHIPGIGTATDAAHEDQLRANVAAVAKSNPLPRTSPSGAPAIEDGPDTNDMAGDAGGAE